MKILLVQARAAALGGAEYYLARLARVLTDMGARVTGLDVEWLSPPEVPPVRLGRRTTGRILFDWSLACRHARRLAPGFDLVIFGFGEGPAVDVPSIHIRHAPSLFSPKPELVAALGSRWPRLRAPYSLTGRLIAGGVGHPAATLVNSRWTGRMAASQCGITNFDVLYPPLPPLPSPAPFPGPRDPNAVVMLGRIVPNKRHLDAARIVADLRAQGWPLRLLVIGRPSGRAGRQIVHQLADLPFVQVFADAGEAQKAQLLGSATFGLHLYPAEHFGIAVAEMIRAGVVPLVHNDGGVTELVPDRALRSRTIDGTRDLLKALLQDPGRIAQMPGRLRSSPALEQASDFDTNAARIFGDLSGGGLRRAA